VLSNLYRIIDFIATAFAFGAAFLKLHATRALPTKLLMAQAIGVKRNKKKIVGEETNNKRQPQINIAIRNCDFYFFKN